MVKGISRRVVVVREPGGRLFEQALFLLREDLPESREKSKEALLREACRVADDYMRRTATEKRSLKPWLTKLAAALVGAAITGVGWLCWVLLV